MIGAKATQVIQELKADGWNEFPSPFRDNKTCLAKNFEGFEKCYCNAPKNKQVEIYKGHTSHGHEFGYEVVVCGELPDGEWVDLRAYGLSSEINKELLDYKVMEMLKTWDFLVKNNKDYKTRVRDEEY
jgi:hypothetical protein